MGWQQGAGAAQGRQYSYTAYRYGFNNQEKDGELGEYYAFEYRVHDARLGRFLSVDPLCSEYPWNSTYSFAINQPTWARELEGLEPWYPTEVSTNKDMVSPANGVPNADNEHHLEMAQEIKAVANGPYSLEYAQKAGWTSNIEEVTLIMREASITVAPIEKFNLLYSNYFESEISSCGGNSGKEEISTPVGGGIAVEQSWVLYKGAANITIQENTRSGDRYLIFHNSGWAYNTNAFGSAKVGVGVNISVNGANAKLDYSGGQLTEQYEGTQFYLPVVDLGEWDDRGVLMDYPLGDIKYGRMQALNFIKIKLPTNTEIIQVTLKATCSLGMNGTFIGSDDSPINQTPLTISIPCDD
jgi:RHS repeat-associated protein